MNVLTLPLPISKNDAYSEMAIAKKAELYPAVKADDWKAVKRAMKVTRHRSQAYREYIESLELPLAAQKTFVLEGDVAMTVTAFFKDRRRDLPNIVDVMFDVLEGVCYANDRQVADFRFRRGIDKENPRVVVKVIAMAPEMFTSEEIDDAMHLEF